MTNQTAPAPIATITAADLDTGDPLPPTRPPPLGTRAEVVGADVTVLAGAGGPREPGAVLGGVRRPSPVHSAAILPEPDAAEPRVADLVVIDDQGLSLAKLDGTAVPWPAKL